MTTLGKLSQIAHIDSPTADLFHSDFVSCGKPVVINGALKRWEGSSRWNTDYLKSVIGAAEVSVEVSQSNFFPSIHESGPAGIKRHRRRIGFSSYADTVSLGNRAADKYYLSDPSLMDRFPSLAEDIESPACLDRKLKIKTNFWFSSADTVTPLHYDLIHNLFAQVRGRKRFTLFAPDQSPLLYPFPPYSECSHFSRVNIRSPDFARFPKFQNARPTELTLAPGEMLYIPPFWWHQVHSVEAAISVSFWWRIAARRYFARQALRLTYPLLLEFIRNFRATCPA